MATGQAPAVRRMRARRESGPPPDPYALGLRFLTARPHGEVELRRKLARRGCEPEAVGAAVARFHDLGYLDDAAFARALAAERSRSRGGTLVAAELASRGLPREIVREALGVLDRETQVAAARRLAARWPALDRRQVAARLQRRGYPPEVIRSVLDAPSAAV